MKKRAAIFSVCLVVLVLLLPVICQGQVQERFPKPDFQSDYTRPELLTTPPTATAQEYIDLLVLFVCLVLASYLAHNRRSRRELFILMVFSLIYFGFLRKGCICAIGAVQNITYGLFEPSYAIPLTVIAFFVLPLIFALFYGRTFCAAVCPLGAIQDVVILKPVNVSPGWAGILGLFPYIYLGLSVLFAATGAGFIICQYDPFIGFFRFGATFDMLLLGLFLLLLGTVIARPYCRFLCPYGVLLNWMSRLSKWHVKITPNECNNCRLCEESCPFGAIQLPNETTQPGDRELRARRLALLFILLPFIVFGSGWVGSKMSTVLARQHFTVSLAEDIIKEDAGIKPLTAETEPTGAFRSAGKPTDQLIEEARALQQKFRLGGWLLGGFLGLIFCLKLSTLSIFKRRNEYTVDTGNCLSCGRCFKYCPYEQVRLGLLPPDQIPEPTEVSTDG